MRRLVLLALLLQPLSVVAALIDYELFDSSNPTVTLGTFVVDPDLAGAIGQSEVQMADLSFSGSFVPFGDINISLTDITTGTSSFRAIFLDGSLASVTGAGSGSLPGGLGFFFDFTPFLPADASLIDLNGVGTYAFDVFDATDIDPFDSNVGSLGIRVANVPESGTLALLCIGLLGVWFARWNRTAEG